MGTQHGFLMDFTPFFQIYRLFIFRYHPEKMDFKSKVWTFGGSRVQI